MNCRNCGIEVVQGEKICRNCNAPVTPPEFGAGDGIGNEGLRPSSAFRQEIQKKTAVVSEPRTAPQDTWDVSLSDMVPMRRRLPSRKVSFLGMLFGLAAFVFASSFPIAPFVFGLPAVVVGFIGIGKYKRGKVMAAVGIFLGLLSFALFLSRFFISDL